MFAPRHPSLFVAVLLSLGGCAKELPTVYSKQIASCSDETGRAEQLRSVRGHADERDLQRSKDAVALAEYFSEHCFPNPHDPGAGSPLSVGTVKEIIESQKAIHNRKYPYNPI